MKTLLIIFITVVSLIMVAYIVMAVMSQKVPEDLGLVDGKLRPCPDSSNCVCSEAHTQNDAGHAVAPLSNKTNAWDTLGKVIQRQGGKIISHQNRYIYATFTTLIFHYVDDVEFRLDSEENVIHMRSASRIGRSDFGVNRKRMEALSKFYE